MKQTKRKKSMVARITTVVKDFFLVTLAIISVVYTKCNKSERIKASLKQVIPATITWIIIALLVISASASVMSALIATSDNGSKWATSSSKSEYVVDKEALAEATIIYEEEQKNKEETSIVTSKLADESIHVEEISEEASKLAEEPEEDSRETKTKEQQASPEANYSLTEAEISMLCQAVQHETGSDPSFYICGDFDTVQQYMAASIINRIGQSGFGVDYTTPNSLYDVLANSVQYGNMLWELSQFNAYDERTRSNVYAVLNGTANVPAYLYFERCSYVGEDYYSAKNSFYEQYGYESTIQVAYMSQTVEGRFIIFATNINGAYAN